MIRIIKPSTKEELKGVADVNFRVDMETMSRFWTDNYAAEYERNGLQGALDSANAFSDHILAAEDEDRVVGMIVFSKAYTNFEDESVIPGSGMVNNVYVLPEYRGRGIGRMLLDAAMEQLWNHSAVVLYVYEDNESAKEFYLHYGYRFDGVSFPDGKAYRGRFQRMVKSNPAYKETIQV